jgi:hypothetical protein
MSASQPESRDMMLTGTDANSPSLDRTKSKDKRKAEKERTQPTFSRPGGFKNDPDDPTNPNEARERFRRKLKP